MSPDDSKRYVDLVAPVAASILSANPKVRKTISPGRRRQNPIVSRFNSAPRATWLATLRTKIRVAFCVAIEGIADRYS